MNIFKTLLISILFSMTTITLHAQSPINNEDVDIEIIGGKSWDEGKFWINIHKTLSSITVKYKIAESVNLEALKQDQAYLSLRQKQKTLTTSSAESKLLSKKAYKIIESHRPTYQDSLTVPFDSVRFSPFPYLIDYVSKADKKKFEGGTWNIISHGDFVFLKIKQNGKNREFFNDAPLSFKSPLMYAFLRKALEIGRDKQFRSVEEIEDKFKYLF